MPQPEQDRRIDYIELPAIDIAATKQFYTFVFGWRFTDYGPEYTAFVDGRLSGGFDAGVPVQRGGALVVVYTTDIAEAEQRIQQAGGTIVKPTFTFPGGQRFHFLDPNGNELAVWSE